MYELTLILLIGILAGVFTGLIPGVHINLVAAVLLGLSPILIQYMPLSLVGVLIVTMSITHNFVDMVPAIFLGAPDDSTALGVLPGHRYLLIGHGLMAVKLTVLGGIFGTILVFLFFWPSMWLLEFLFTTTKHWVFWILLAFTFFTVLKDKKRMWAGLIFVLSGLVGIITLRLPLAEPLLPMLSGLFGVATLLYSIKEKNTIPPQEDLPYTDFHPRKTIIGSLLGTIGAFITALFPGISSAMAAALVSQGQKLGDHGFMVLIGSLGSASFVLSLAAWLAIEKARNGAMAVVVQLGEINPVVLGGSMLVATGVAALVTLWLGKKAAIILPKIPYTQTCVAVILFIVGIVYLRTSWLGLLVLGTSTAVGLLPAALKTARAQGMGCLVLPLLVVLW
ncbi:MAG: tripartite tricarboxylate transporter permease [Candidatus Woesearchaeota archaeon]|nr:tripartite tricarboxylate transporter permease [Candidatus Woesearchaeota archaeon]